MASTPCITYLDEAKHSGRGQHRSIHHYTIVSITATTSDYLSSIEPHWHSLRIKHGIPDGLTLHFTDLRLLLQPGQPFQKYSPDLLQLFSKSRSPLSIEIDYPRLYAFFLDVLNFIKAEPLKIHATGIKSDRNGLIRQINLNYFQDFTYRPPYHAFKEHMNLMALYLMNLYSGTYNARNCFFTKLRFDGDVDFGERDDVREAFNHCISLGTRHFRPQLVKRVFDEIRFIGKNEVAQATPNGGITHAGNEITDFLAVMVSRYIWNIDMHKTVLAIPDHPPLDSIPFIQPKLVAWQCLDDNFFCK
ncbi:hypothetical protein [Alicyclobacillus macrosporangiidus]|uniref:DUF3800 domain-containing protein n=1 Tax=Alicyclobacillus macrosporangiidus TaxID=392015 RepID=A0A1I7L1X1_9BACL|nr:hypothetical protein [Alicyclobacillus macrosporangiidus]SFV03772.1 hypothetical protein SAMN05421543_12334 [Alicyclobacillus macrosporangiidus]